MDTAQLANYLAKTLTKTLENVCISKGTETAFIESNMLNRAYIWLWYCDKLRVHWTLYFSHLKCIVMDAKIPDV